MRLTVLQQQTKALQEDRPENGAEVSKRVSEIHSGRNHKRRSQNARRLDPRLFGTLLPRLPGAEEAFAFGPAEYARDNTGVIDFSADLFFNASCRQRAFGYVSWHDLGVALRSSRVSHKFTKFVKRSG
jgi:hypothetical protein